MANQYRTMKAGDLEPAFNPYLTDPVTNAPVPLDVVTSITVSAAQNGNILFSDRTAAGDSAGQVTMAWQPGDTDEAGAIALEVAVELSPGRIQRFPSTGFFMIQINADLGSGPPATG